jgi:hypothetical protein
MLALLVVFEEFPATEPGMCNKPKRRGPAKNPALNPKVPEHREIPTRRNPELNQLPGPDSAADDFQQAPKALQKSASCKQAKPVAMPREGTENSRVYCEEKSIINPFESCNFACLFVALFLAQYSLQTSRL